MSVTPERKSCGLRALVNVNNPPRDRKDKFDRDDPVGRNHHRGETSSERVVKCAPRGLRGETKAEDLVQDLNARYAVCLFDLDRRNGMMRPLKRRGVRLENEYAIRSFVAFVKGSLSMVVTQWEAALRADIASKREDSKRALVVHRELCATLSRSIAAGENLLKSLPERQRPEPVEPKVLDTPWAPPARLAGPAAEYFGTLTIAKTHGAALRRHVDTVTLPEARKTLQALKDANETKDNEVILEASKGIAASIAAMKAHFELLREMDKVHTRVVAAVDALEVKREAEIASRWKTVWAAEAEGAQWMAELAKLKQAKPKGGRRSTPRARPRSRVSTPKAVERKLF